MRRYAQYEAAWNKGQQRVNSDNSDGDETQVYLGMRSDTDPALAGDIPEATLRGNFPGVVYGSLNVSDGQRLMDDIAERGLKSVGAISVIPSVCKTDFEIEEFVQGFEKLIDTRRG